MAKHEITRCIYCCRHLSFPFQCSHAKLLLYTDTHTPPLALMHFYCPHPLFFLSSSTSYHYITVFLCCSATRLASPSLICPACLHFIPLCLSLSLLLTQSFYSPPHPSLSLTGQLALVYSPLSTSRSPSAIFSRFFAPYLTGKQKQT